MEEQIVEELFACLHEWKGAEERIPVVPGDMGRPQMSILYSIYDLSRRSPEVRVTDISSRMGVKPSNVISNIKELERRGYVSKASDTRDRRVVHVALTEKGSVLVDRYVLAYYRLLGRELDDCREEVTAAISAMERLLARLKRAKAAFAEQLGGIEE